MNNNKFTIVSSAYDDEIEDKVLLEEYRNRDKLGAIERALIERRYNHAVEDMKKNKLKGKRKH